MDINEFMQAALESKVPVDWKPVAIECYNQGVNQANAFRELDAQKDKQITDLTAENEELKAKVSGLDASLESLSNEK